MSMSNETTEWHLTPEGWVQGTQDWDYTTEEVPVPEATVATYEFSESQSSGYSRVHRETNFVRQQGTDDEHQELLNKFGECPKSLYAAAVANGHTIIK